MGYKEETLNMFLAFQPAALKVYSEKHLINLTGKKRNGIILEQANITGKLMSVITQSNIIQLW